MWSFSVPEMMAYARVIGATDGENRWSSEGAPISSPAGVLPKMLMPAPEDGPTLNVAKGAPEKWEPRARSDMVGTLPGRPMPLVYPLYMVSKARAIAYGILFVIYPQRPRCRL